MSNQPQTAQAGVVTTRGAVAVAQPTEQMQFTPANVSQAWRLAKMLSESGLVPSSLRGKPSDVLVVLMSGRELGIPPMQSLRTLHVIEGRIQMAAEMMVARCKQSPSICIYFRMVESTEEKATYATLRAGAPEPTVYTYTIKDAEAAGLANKDNWRKNRRAMLRARASSGLARIEYPDLVSGIVIDDEVEEIRMTAANIAGASAASTEATITARIQAVDVESEAVQETPPHDPETGEIIEKTTEPTPSGLSL